VKLLFTRLQEEVTTVKKSVTELRVEVGPALKTDEFPVIELEPESPKIDHREINRPSQGSPEHRKTPLALSARTGQVTDVVDLQGVTQKNVLGPVTYSADGVSRVKPCLESLEGDRAQKLEKDYSYDKASVYQAPDKPEIFSILDERRARYQFTARKFISTQEMIEYHSSQEKRFSFELTI
jgi:hypothetical protein